MSFKEFKNKVFDLPILFDVVRWCLMGSYHPMFSNLTKFVDHKEGEKVLEVGCGTGIFSKLFGKDYTGIDFFEGFIKNASNRNPDGKFLVMDANNMTFPKRSFDKILLLSFIHHIDDDEVEKILKEVRQYAKKGIYIMELVPQKYNLIGRFLYSMDRGDHIRDFFFLKDLINRYTPIRRYHMFRSLFYKCVLIECAPDAKSL